MSQQNQGKVTKIAQKIHCTTFAKKYRRVTRENNTVSPDNVADEIKLYLPDLRLKDSSVYVFAAAKKEPVEGFTLAKDFEIDNLVNVWNDLLVYRVLKGLYGSPDILGIHMHQSGPVIPVRGTPSPVFPGIGTTDWGYTLQITNDLLVEIRRVPPSRAMHILFWLSYGVKDDVDVTEDVESLMLEFINDLRQAIEKNRHLFNYKGDIQRKSERLKDTYLSAYSNVYGEMYKSGELLVELSSILPNPAPRSIPKPGESVPASTSGCVYRAAAMFYIVALESFINTLYSHLLKEDFEDDRYRRITVRSDLDLRILAMHVFCKGFVKQPIEPKTDLWDRLIELRDFRNDVFHGNLTDEHRMTVVPEDWFWFTYRPQLLQHSEKIQTHPLSRQMPHLREEGVAHIRTLIDDVVEAIIEALDNDYQAWVRSWLHGSMVIPLPPAITDKSKKE